MYALFCQFHNRHNSNFILEANKSVSKPADDNQTSVITYLNSISEVIYHLDILDFYPNQAVDK